MIYIDYTVSAVGNEGVGLPYVRGISWLLENQDIQMVHTMLGVDHNLHNPSSQYFYSRFQFFQRLYPEVPTMDHHENLHVVQILIHCYQ